MSAILLRTPSFRPVFALPAAAISAVLFAVLFIAWQGFSSASLQNDVALIELTQEFAPPPLARAGVGSSAPPKVEQARDEFQGFQTLAVPDAIGARIAAPGEVAFKAGAIGAALAPGVPLTQPNRESYALIVENVFLAARHNPLSTFGIDVDRASYANVRRFIGQGMRPPVDAVRIEELVNYFPYGYAGPTDDRPFAVHTEVAAAPWAPTHRLVKIGIQGERVAMEGMPAANLVFLVDVSGSMQSVDKLPLVKSSLRLLVERMRSQDRVALVVYAGAAGLVLPPTAGSEKRAILDAIDRLEAGGSTAGGAGLELAYAVAREHHVAGGNNRVILATDGDFNVGPSSDSEMVRLIEEKREQGTFLTVLGFGTGNLQDAKMEQIADRGNGNFAYIDGLFEARKVLVHELGGTLLTIAKDVKVQVEFNPEKVAAYRLIGYENRVMAAEDFADDKKDGGELGSGHTVTALYEVVPVGDESSVELRAPGALRYQAPTETSADAAGDELLFVQLRYKQPDESHSTLVTHPVRDALGTPSADFKFAAAVAGFGMLLRESPHAGDLGMSDVLALARAGLGADPEGFRAGFIELVERARGLELVAGR
jgi:Ca-activated chloride channel family protein